MCLEHCPTTCFYRSIRIFHFMAKLWPKRYCCQNAPSSTVVKCLDEGWHNRLANATPHLSDEEAIHTGFPRPSVRTPYTTSLFRQSKSRICKVSKKRYSRTHPRYWMACRGQQAWAAVLDPSFTSSQLRCNVVHVCRSGEKRSLSQRTP